MADVIVQQPIRSVYKDGSTVISNVKSKIDNSTTSYSVVTTWYDGSAMDDSKVDEWGVYSKYKATGEYLRENKPQWGELFLEVDTVSNLRAMCLYNQFLLKVGYYKGVRLGGYFEKGDTPSPLDYFLSTTIEDDDGGSVYVVNSMKFKHTFSSKIDARYYGVMPTSKIDQSSTIQRAIDAGPRLGKRIYFSAGMYFINGRHNAGGRGIMVPSNSDIETDENAVFKVLPQESGSYTAFSFVNVENIYINQLNLVGDKDEHLGTSGEWGMGISLLSAKNITIDSVIARKFWGDGIYLGTGPDGSPNQNINIYLSEISQCRRQGMSVINVDGLNMETIKIDTIAGAPPQAGIDFEPNYPNEVFKRIKINRIECTNAENYAVTFVFHNLNASSEPVDIQIGEIISEINGALRISGDSYPEKVKGLAKIGVIRSKDSRYHAIEIYNIKNGIDVHIGDVYVDNANQAGNVYPYGAGIRIFASSGIIPVPGAIPNVYKINNIYSTSSDGKMTKIVDVYEHNKSILDAPDIHLDILGEVKGNGIAIENTGCRIKSKGNINYSGIRNNLPSKLITGADISLTTNTLTKLDNTEFPTETLFSVNNLPIGWEIKIEIKQAARLGIAASYNFKLFHFQTFESRSLTSAIVGSFIVVVHMGSNIWDIKNMGGRWFYGTEILRDVVVNATLENAGISQLANEQEVINGINTVKTITPATLQKKLASTALIGLVKQSVLVSDVLTNNSDKTTVADATDLETAIALINDLKLKYNQAVDLINELKNKLNSKLSADRASGQQSSI